MVLIIVVVSIIIALELEVTEEVDSVVLEIVVLFIVVALVLARVVVVSLAELEKDARELVPTDIVEVGDTVDHVELDDAEVIGAKLDSD